MTELPDEIRSLGDALKLSPENILLRKLYAQRLSAIGRHEDAEREWLAALQRHPDDFELRLELARTYRASSKRSHALALLENLVKRDRGAAPALVLQAQILLESGELDAARRAFARALEETPELAQDPIARRLGFEALASGTPEAPGALGAPTAAPIDEQPEREPDAPPFSELERPNIAFAEVGGMRQLKEEISIKILQPLLHPELFEAYGKKIGGGILLYGPPGCGKTLIARATAGEVKARFLSVGIHDVLDMWIGKSERNLHELFAAARRSKPCVMFFDEVDALGGKRTDMVTHAGRSIVNQFLSELDGVKDSNEGVLVLAATNAPWHLDSAVRRPGRFDRILFVPPPDDEARAAILRILLAGKPCDAIDHAAVAKRTSGFSGADLKAIVDQTIEVKLKSALQSGRPEPIRQKDLIECAARIVPTTKEWFATARNYALYSNQGGLYDDVAKYLKL